MHYPSPGRLDSLQDPQDVGTGLFFFDCEEAKRHIAGERKNPESFIYITATTDPQQVQRKHPFDLPLLFQNTMITTILNQVTGGEGQLMLLLKHRRASKMSKRPQSHQVEVFIVC